MQKIIDFHSHTFFSDGELSPAELIRRAFVAGYKVLGITDHVDFSNIDFVFDNINKLCRELDYYYNDMLIVPGVEITHVPPHKIEKIVTIARDKNIPLVIVHGESPVEPVAVGTNRASIEAGVDILAHPGLITESDMELAAKKDVFIEISSRKGHGITDGYIAKLAKKYGNKLVLDSDAHTDSDFLTEDYANKVLVGCAMEQEQIDWLGSCQQMLVNKIKSRLNI